MPGFVGGSAPAMANQIVDGFFLINKNTLKGMTPGDLGLLKSEIEKLQREVRSETPAQEDALAQQTRNRRISRLSAALQVIQAQLMGRRF
jgi:hypothetical protein